MPRFSKSFMQTAIEIISPEDEATSESGYGTGSLVPSDHPSEPLQGECAFYRVSEEMKALSSIPIHTLE